MKERRQVEWQLEFQVEGGCRVAWGSPELTSGVEEGKNLRGKEGRRVK